MSCSLQTLLRFVLFATPILYRCYAGGGGEASSPDAAEAQILALVLFWFESRSHRTTHFATPILREACDS